MAKTKTVQKTTYMCDSGSKCYARFLACKYLINNTILNILFTLFYNVFKTLKWKYMLNLTSSDKTSEMPFHLHVQSL